jgi:hypothetical protein
MPNDNKFFAISILPMAMPLARPWSLAWVKIMNDIPSANTKKHRFSIQESSCIKIH